MRKGGQLAPGQPEGAEWRFQPFPTLGCAGVTVFYYSRSLWTDDPVNAGYPVPPENIVGLVVHHTALVVGDYDSDGIMVADLDDIARYMQLLRHIANQRNIGDECPYSYVVFPHVNPYDGIVVEGRGYGRSGAHTIGYNSTRYGVAFAMNTVIEGAPTPGMLNAFNYIGQSKLTVPTPMPTFAHRDVDNTICPGDNAYDALPLLQPPFSVLSPPNASGDDSMPTPATVTGSFVRRRPMGLTAGILIVTADGGVFSHAGADFYGSVPGLPGVPPLVMGQNHIVSGLSTETGNGYWLLGIDGGIFTFGDAEFYGAGGLVPDEHAIELVAYAHGYAIITSAHRILPHY